MSTGRLLVCPTPIGNLEDITLRVLRALREADLVACEDTRRTGRLLAHFAIDAPLVSLHEHNERARAGELVGRIRAGSALALVSDAGTPTVSDPGWLLLRSCVEEGLRVEVLPGPSAVITALVRAALPAERWRFVGFLPRRERELAVLWDDPDTLVAFESPRRLAGSLRALAAVQPARPVAVCRELTKLHEEVLRGPAAELAERFARVSLRGEIVLVVGPQVAGGSDDRVVPARVAVQRLAQAGARRRVAARVVAELTGLSANALYDSGDPGDGDDDSEPAS